MKIVINLTLVCLLFGSVQVCAQDIRSDYRSGPVHYQPEDPWVRGKIFQIHTGHGGWFYNCDHQEDKRFSPYIRWNRQPCWSYPDCPIKHDIHQQLNEVKRRICWGQGDCCHRTDRLCPNPGNATPYVETFEPFDEHSHEQINDGHIHDSYLAPGPNTQTRRSNGRNERLTRQPATSNTNKVTYRKSTTRREVSKEDRYLVEEPKLNGRR